ncbi:MAG: soluble NSF attachment family protein [Bacteroidales bacterium]|nr:soluble NSF attachment family protein [Bacteroidales bacterium]
MAKSKKKESPKGIENVEQTLTRTEQFLEDNYRSMLYILGVVVVIVGVAWLGRMRTNNRTEEAQSQMFVAEDYFAMDSLNYALYGDGNYLGFIDIADEYGTTPSGNLARYYAGISFLQMGEFEQAIEYLEKFKKKDIILAPVALGATGDAYIELGETAKGLDYYRRAAEYTENSFYAPVYLMKAAQIHELEGNYEKALESYNKIKENYPDSNEGNNIEKYIARINSLR